MTQCCFCRGTPGPGRATAKLWRYAELTLIEKVPAFVCDDCGEPCFDAQTCRQLDRLMETPPLPLRTLEVPVYAFDHEER